MALTWREDFMWLVGLMEGEGYFVQAKRGVRIGILMTDKDVLERAASIFGPHARWQAVKRQKQHYKPAYRFMVSGQEAVGWMMMLYPFMGARRKARIYELLAWWRTLGIAPKNRHTCPLGHAYDSVEWWRRNKNGEPAPERRCLVCYRAASNKWARKDRARKRRDTETATFAFT